MAQSNTSTTPADAPPPATAAPRKRRRWPVLLALALAPFYGLFQLYCYALLAHPNAGPEHIRIAPKTTHVVSPLDDAGRVDFLAALNEQGRAGVTPENNAAVVLIHAIGPNGWASEASFDEFYRQLGAAPPPEDGSYWMPFDRFSDLHPELQPPELTVDVNANVSDEQIAQFDAELNRAIDEADWSALYRAVAANPEFDSRVGDMTMAFPWRREDVPLMAAWLDQHEPHLAIMAQAAERERYFAPLLSDETVGRVLSADNEFTYRLHYATSQLVARAMLKLGVGDAEGAWNDLHVAHRLARLIGQEPTVLGALLNYGVEREVLRGEQMLAHNGGLSSEKLLRIRDALRTLPPLAQLGDKLDVGERLQLCDMLISGAANGGLGNFEIDFLGRQLGWWNNQIVDWNEVLIQQHGYIDAFVAAAREPRGPARKIAHDQLLAAIQADMREAWSPWRIATSAVVGSRRGERVGVALFARAGPMLMNLESQARIESQLELTEIALALAAYRADQGEYPDALALLAPQYLLQAPIDVDSSQPLIYRREAMGYTLYGVGPDGQDDGGLAMEDSDIDNYDHVLPIPPRLTTERLENAW